jgi:predicted N-acetyltransferase YhbS
MKHNIEIKFLTDCKEHIPTLAKLWYEEISRHWVPDSSIEKAKDRLIAHLNEDKIPMAIVALHDKSPVGMACLRETDGIQPGITPWLGSLVVNPKFRGQQIGETLIDAVKAKAKLFHHDILYLLAFDPTIPNWYARLGWQTIGEDSLLGHRVTVMSIVI